MDKLKIKEDSITKTEFPKDMDVVQILKIADNLSYNKEIKEVREYNEKLSNSRYTEQTFISTLYDLESIYKKCLENGDTFQIWKKIEYKKGFFDNICLVGHKVGEAQKENDYFCNIGARNEKDNSIVSNIEECYFDGIYYDPKDKRNEWYLTTPDELLSSLYIEINGIQVSLDDISKIKKNYLETEFKRYNKDELLKLFIDSENDNTKKDLINNIKDSYGVVFDTFYIIDIKDKTEYTLEQLKTFLSEDNDYLYLDKSLYSLYEKDDKIILVSDQRILNNSDGVKTPLEYLENFINKDFKQFSIEQIKDINKIKEFLPEKSINDIEIKIEVEDNKKKRKKRNII